MKVARKEVVTMTLDDKPYTKKLMKLMRAFFARTHKSESGCAPANLETGLRPENPQRKDRENASD